MKLVILFQAALESRLITPPGKLTFKIHIFDKKLNKSENERELKI